MTECARLEADFAEFVKAAWHIVRPGLTLDWSWHYDLMAEHLTLVYERKLRRLIINVSPRTLKSIFVSVMFPAWVWTKQPSHNFASASHSMSLSTEHSVMRRNLIESEWYQQRWGHKVSLAKDQNEKTKFKNNHQAQMIATSVGSKPTGIGGNTLILDDGMDPKGAASEAQRKEAHDWFDNRWRSRMNDPAEDCMIVMEQRTGELDITGHLLDADDILEMQHQPREWTHLAIPLECDEESGRQEYIYPISGRIKEREVGDVLQPKRFPPEVVAALKVRRIVWSTQYQQRPSPLEGNMIKRSEIRYHSGTDPLTGEADRVLPAKFDRILTSVDCSFKDEATSDYVAIGTIGIYGPDRFILEVVNKHLDEPATRREIERQRLKWGSTVVLVEDKANGSAVIKALKRKIPGIIAIEPEGGKIARMYVSCGAWQSGNWYVDRNAAWCEPFVEQITKFPAGKNDDMADMMTQAEIWIESKVLRLGLNQYMQAEQKKIDEADMAKRTKKSVGITTAEQTTPITPEEGAAVTEKMVAAGDITKVVTPDNALRCPSCGSTSIGRLGREYRCQQCGTQFGGEKPSGSTPTQDRKSLQK